MAMTKRRQGEGFIEISTMLEELEKDLPAKVAQVEGRKASAGKEAILEVLARAADDPKFLARLAENPSKVLQEYGLTSEESRLGFR